MMMMMMMMVLQSANLSTGLFCLPAYLPTCLPVFMLAYFPPSLPTCLPTCLPACTYLPEYLPTYLSTYLPSRLTSSISACPPTYLAYHTTTCIAASCRSPGGIDNGRKMGQDYSHGKTVRYECDSGYTVEGENSLTCNDGTWNFDPPKCGGN